MTAFGKTLAMPGNYVSIDPNHPDEFGIPAPVVHYRFVENDFAMWREQKQGMLEICSRMKGTLFTGFGDGPIGFASHEVGTARMGKNPKTSALNSFCQSHEVRNLFVTDGSCFTTSSEKNPTLTLWPYHCERRITFSGSKNLENCRIRVTMGIVAVVYERRHG